MTGLTKWMFLLILSSIHAQDPRRRIFNQQMIYPFDEFQLSKTDDEGIPCFDHNCLPKRSGQDESGPFWANRGKKDPTYMHESLFADEPYWVLVRKDDRFQEEPFFMSRGKKELGTSVDLKHRNRRDFADDIDSPFFASRGKRLKTKTQSNQQ